LDRQVIVKLLTGLLLWLGALSVYANSPDITGDNPVVAVIQDLENPFDLTPFIEYLVDQDRKLTIEEIQAGKFVQTWQRNTSSVFVGQNPNYRYWFRIRLNYQQDFTTLRPLLYVPSQPALNTQLTVWIPDENGSYRQITTGYIEPYQQRDIANFRYVFRLPSAKSAFTIIGFADNSSSALPVILPLTLLSTEQFSAADHQVQRVMIAFYAILFSVLLYNGCLFISLRQALYGYYLLFLGCAMLTCAFIDGITTSWLGPNIPMLNLRMSSTNGFFSALFYLAFVWEALDHLRFSPPLMKGFKFLIGFGGVMVVYGIFTPSMSLTTVVTQIYSGLTFSFVLIAIILAIRQRIPTAGYFLVAEICALAGGTGFMLVIQDRVPINDTSIWVLHYGVLSEAILLSLALAARTRIAQQAAIENLQKYETLYNDSIEGMFQFDFMSNSLKCNDAFAQLFGHKNAQSLPTDGNVLSYFSHEIQKELPSSLREKGHIRNYEVELDNPSTQSKIWVSITMQMVMNDEGNLAGAEGSMIDISERKLKEQAEIEKNLAEKQRSNAEKNQAISEAQNKAKSQFFASMSHEFRTPLTAIIGYTDLADRPTTSEVERKDHIKTIRHGAQHLLQLINDILDLSKIEAQQMDVEAIPVNLLQIVQEVYEFVWILAEQKGIRFHIDYQFPLPEIIISDPTRLKQALINLCSNSVKFTHKGGVTLHITCDASAQQLSFAVEDTGIGLKPEQIQKLFSAFVQVDSSTSRTFGGTGLGLYLSKLIANKLGGDIRVTSEYGKGSTFTIAITTGSLENVVWLEKLPLNTEAPIDQNEESITVSPVAQLGAQQGEKIKVLLADDNLVNQKLVGFHLQQMGAEVVYASDGLEAIAESINGKVDLILMDMEMPYLDGMVVVSLLRKKGFAKPIYALTGNVNEEAQKESKDAGCDGHLSKPLDTAKLSAVIQSLR